MEDNEEEEDNDNYPMFTEDGDSTMGGDEAEEEPIFDEPDDDFGWAILDAKINCGSDLLHRHIHFSLGSFMTYSMKVPDWTSRRETCEDLGYTFVL